MSTPTTIKRNEKTEEDILDLTLRPKTWEEYIGQEKVKQNLKIIITAAKKRKEPIEHLLFYGGSGLGKTTLAHLVAKEIGKEIKVVSGPAIERAGDLAAILTNLEEGSVLFCDEIHRLSRVIEEYLYPAMEDFKLNLILGKGPMARTMEIKLPRFTLIGATTRLALVSGPLRSRFGAIFGLNFYEISDIKKILERSARILNIKTDEEALEIIAKSSRFTPRIANHLLKRVRDFAQVKGEGKITKEIAKEALQALEIDELGLTSQDRRILEAIIKKFNGGPVGLQALAAATAEEEDTILDIYEPYLMRVGFIERTPRGRVATKLAFQHLGVKFKDSQCRLL
jgi:Holliday junction DNA helicase RuvB